MAYGVGAMKRPDSGVEAAGRMGCIGDWNGGAGLPGHCLGTLASGGGSGIGTLKSPNQRVECLCVFWTGGFGRMRWV